MRFSIFRILAMVGFLVPAVPSAVVWAQEAAVPAVETASAPVTEPLTVADVLVDKSAENAVVARDQAIVEARKSALQKLAERNMTPESFKAFVLPDDQTIATLVQDFQIDSEQLSATRYVAHFTVRFRDGVRRYIDIKPIGADASVGGGVSGMPSAGSEIPVASEIPALLLKPLLILPYYEDISGRTLLWEDPNPWREAWQSAPPVLPKGQGPLFVPLGDIGDIGAGASNAVWSGDYSAVEALRKNYNAENVVLAVANKSGPSMVIDVYVYSGGGLQRLASLTPYVDGVDDAAAFLRGMQEVLTFLKRPAPSSAETGALGVEGISRSLVAPAPAVAAADDNEIRWESGWSKPATTAAPGPDLSVPPASLAVPVPGQAELRATMAFEDFAQWVEMQKRLSAVTPPVRVTIRSLNRTGAQFTVQYAGSSDAFRQSLAAQGIVMGLPTVEVGDSSGGGMGRLEIYDLRLAQ